MCILHIMLSCDQLSAALLIGRNAVTWLSSVSNDEHVGSWPSITEVGICMSTHSNAEVVLQHHLVNEVETTFACSRWKLKIKKNNFRLMVGHMTKQIRPKHGHLYDIHIWWTSVENIAHRLHPPATFSTSGSWYLNVSLTTMRHLYNVALNGHICRRGYYWEG